MACSGGGCTCSGRRAGGAAAPAARAPSRPLAHVYREGQPPSSPFHLQGCGPVEDEADAALGAVVDDEHNRLSARVGRRGGCGVASAAGGAGLGVQRRGKGGPASTSPRCPPPSPPSNHTTHKFTCQYSAPTISGARDVASRRPPISGAPVACAHVSSLASVGFCGSPGWRGGRRGGWQGWVEGAGGKGGRAGVAHTARDDQGLGGELWKLPGWFADATALPAHSHLYFQQHQVLFCLAHRPPTVTACKCMRIIASFGY